MKFIILVGPEASGKTLLATLFSNGDINTAVRDAGDFNHGTDAEIKKRYVNLRLIVICATTLSSKAQSNGILRASQLLAPLETFIWRLRVIPQFQKRERRDKAPLRQL
jgi:hypothetical protein